MPRKTKTTAMADKAPQSKSQGPGSGRVRQARSLRPRIAMAHGLNANLVHKWRRLASAPVPAVSSSPEDVRIVLHRGPLSIKVSWPVSAAPACAAWLREFLR